MVFRISADFSYRKNLVSNHTLDDLLYLNGDRYQQELQLLGISRYFNMVSVYLKEELLHR